MENIQQMYIQLQEMENIIESMHNFIEQASDSLNKRLIIKEVLKSLDNTKDMKTSIGDGLYLSTSLKDKDKIYVNAGNNVVKVVDNDSALKIVEERIKTTEDTIEKMAEELNGVIKEAEILKHKIIESEKE